MIFKRVVAILAIVLLVGIYIFALISAIFFSGSESTKGIFNAALYSTVVVPCFAWVMVYVYDLIKKISGTDTLEDDSQENK